MTRPTVLAVALALAATLVSATGALARGEVIRLNFVDVGSAVVTDLCPFEVTVAWDLDNASVFRIEGATPDTQVWGHHAVRGEDVWSNEVNGRSVSVRWYTMLARTDLDFSAFSIDDAGLWQGTITAVDHYSGTYVGSVPGYGAVVLSSGHFVALQSSTFLDDVRIARTDEVIFNAGPSDDLGRLCDYLGGS